MTNTDVYITCDIYPQLLLNSSKRVVELSLVSLSRKKKSCYFRVAPSEKCYRVKPRMQPFRYEQKLYRPIEVARAARALWPPATFSTRGNASSESNTPRE